MSADDVLAPESGRFTLATAFEELDFSDAPASGAATRPFVLRVAGVPAPRFRRTLPPARYCADRQLSVTDDDRAEPLFRLGFERTTIGSKDGQDPAQEDWKPDT